jgi:hypothetical protein
MRKYTFPLILTAGVVIVMAAVFAWHWQPQAPRPAAAAPPATAPPASTPEIVPPEPSVSRDSELAATPPPVVSAPAPAPRTRSENEEKFRSATDYLAFAREMLPKAKAGDRDAQYHLYAAMDYCRSGYRGVFDEGQKRRTLEEALAADGPLPVNEEREIRQLHSRCQGLMSSEGDDLGEAQQWLTRSAAAGNPRAQVQLAGKMAQTGVRMSGEQSARTLAEARRLTREALSTRDPEVVWRAGTLSAVGLSAPDGLDAKAWTQAACDRGLDCGPGSDAAREVCRLVPNCQPSESVYDLLRRSVDNPAALDENAKRVNALIDAGDWQSLGLEAPPRNP